MSTLLHFKCDNKDEANVAASVFASEVSSTGSLKDYEPQEAATEKPKDDAVREAVFSYIQAVRALGYERVNTAQIATALDLRPSDVETVVDSLANEGVRKAR